MGQDVMLNGTSLGSRLISIVVIINIVILGLIAALAFSSSNAALRARALETFNMRQQQAARLTNDLLESVYQMATQYTASVGNRTDLLDSSALRSFTHQYVMNDSDEVVTRLSIQRPDSSVAVLTLPNPLNPMSVEWRIYRYEADMPRNPTLLTVRETQAAGWFFQSNAQYDPQLRPSITLAIPYQNIKADGTLFKGVVWVDVPLLALQDTMAQLLSDSGLLTDTVRGYTLLADAQGQLLTRHNLMVDLTSSAKQQEVTTLIARLNATTPLNNLYTLDEPFYETNALIKRAITPTAGWQLISVLPTSELPALPTQIIAPIGLVALTGLLILAWVMNRTIDQAIVQPLQDMGLAAQEIGSGDLRYQVGYQVQQDEIGRLARALDDMKSSIAHSYDELSRWSRTLEERVKQRTLEATTAQRAAEDVGKELREIYDESLLVVNEPQLRPVLNAFVQRLLKLFAASYSSVWLLNEDKNQLLLAVSTEGDDDINGAVMERDEGLTGATIEAGRPIRVEDYRTYPRRRAEIAEEMPFVRTVSVPLMFVGRAIGAVIVGRPEDAPPFTERDERLLTLFANLVSPSVRNAQLFVRMNEAGEEAGRANQVKTRFLASVTHELRTPLNLIINNMDFMRIGAFGDVTEEQLSRLNQTVRSAEHLLYLINDLLDVSKIDAGEMHMFIQPADLYPLLDDTVDNIYAFIEKLDPREEQVDLVIEIDDGLPVLPIDARRIRQVLTNLLTNAVKFTAKGSITFTVRRVAAGVEFRVRDTGPGIPADEMDKLFAAFERTRQAKESNIEGTGLGLPISQFLVRAHGGDLRVESVVGEGTTFWFVLPLEQQADRTDPERNVQRMRELLMLKPE